MKRSIFLLLISCLLCSSIFCQHETFIGTWTGAIQPGLNIIFHFTHNNGTVSATLDSPSQGTTGLACSNVAINNDSITVDIDIARAKYLGKLVNDSTISGIWKQGGGMAPLQFKKGETIKGPNRPQTPKPPFDYNTEDVTYYNADKTVHLAGTFTWPKGTGKFVTVILVTGSGQQDRDETIFNHKPFAVLADHLTKNDIAVLRVDDRGMGKSTGEIFTATSADFAADVKSGINYLKTRPEVNVNKIGIIGHSEGGVIAPMVAAHNNDVDFIIMWAGPIIGGVKINVQQNAGLLLKSGISTTATEAFSKLHQNILEQFNKTTDTADLHRIVKSTFAEWRKRQPDTILQKLYVNNDHLLGQNVYKMYDGLFSNPWMRFFITHDFEKDLAGVQCKVLAINGSLDTQVGASDNLKAVETILVKNGNKNVTTIELKGLNHLLQNATTGDLNEYGTIEETIAPKALQVITDWIKQQVINNRK